MPVLGSSTPVLGMEVKPAEKSDSDIFAKNLSITMLMEGSR